MQDYDVFLNLPFKLRLKAGGAFILLYLTMVALSHLALKPFLEASTETSWFLFSAYFSFLALTLFSMMPMLYMKYRKYQFVILGISFFGGFILSFVYVNNVQKIIPNALDLDTRLLWGGGILALLLGISLYTEVLKNISGEMSQIEAEMKVAQKIHSQLVPVIEKENAYYQVFGKSVAAKEIGGDFFDVVDISPRRLAAAIGDVSGHNIGAGLLMAISKSAFRTELEYLSSPEKLAASMNKTIVENSDKQMFVSFACGIFDFEESNVRLVNAGHLPVLHYQATSETIVERNPKGIGLGLIKSAVYESRQARFEKGDVFCFITDGLEEAENSQKDPFGLEKIKEVLARHAKKSPKEIHTAMSEELKQFMTVGALRDDTTFLAVKIL